MNERRSRSNPLRRHAVLCLLPLAAVAPALALDPGKALSQYVLSSWARQGGLTQSSIMSVAQTSDGFLWLATEEGLVRFDGLSFRTFDERNSSGLPDRFIRSLAPGRDGSLWIGTRSGLVQYREGKFRSFAKETNFREDVYDLCVSTDGSVWFSSPNGLYHFLNGKTRIYTTADGLPDNGITAIAESPDGSVWVGTRAGLSRLSTGGFTTYSASGGALSNSINTLSVGPTGSVWIGTIDGRIERWSAGTVTTWWDGSSHRGARVQCIREDRDGNLWIAFYQLGLGRMRGRKLELFTKKEGLPSLDPDWLFEDRQKTMWIGWADAGLSSLRDAAFTNIGVLEGLSSDLASSVLEARDGSLWVGTQDAGLNHIQNGHVTIYSEKQGLGGKNVLALFEGRDGDLWSGSQDGVLSLVRNGRISTYHDLPRNAPPRLLAMLADKTGGLWLGYDIPDGLVHFHEGHFDHFPLEGWVRGLAEWNGAIWIAAYGKGLTRFQGGQIRNYSEKDGLSSPMVTCVYADREGIVWAGTAQSGLNRIQDGHITTYSVGEGLFDSSVGSITEDDQGYLWMTSSRGISRVSKRELTDVAEGRTKSVQSRAFGYDDGLRSPECTMGPQPGSWKGRDGRMWFATIGGAASIDARQIRDDEPGSEARVERLTFDGGAPVPLDRQITLQPGNGRLEISFASPNFISPERMKLRYRLKGFDADWIPTEARRTATYTNLPPAHYHFELQAANNQGVWNGPESSLDFELLPHFYQALWFHIGCAACFGLLSWRLYQARVRYLLLKTGELEEKISMRTAELSKAVQEAELAREFLREQAMRDSLTGLLNRRAIFEHLESQIARCRGSQGLCILMADLDHFKAINDTYGHLVGDQVLQEAARRLRDGVRGTESVGRYGGEELLVVLPDCSLSVGIVRARELLHLLRATSISTDSGELNVTCSFGVASLGVRGDARDLVGDADSALYNAKAAGRNCVSANLQEIPSPLFQLAERMKDSEALFPG